jgi:hypothetical protein
MTFLNESIRQIQTQTMGIMYSVVFTAFSWAVQTQIVCKPYFSVLSALCRPYYNIVDAYIHCKLSEPAEWAFCVCFFDRWGDYVEKYDNSFMNLYSNFDSTDYAGGFNPEQMMFLMKTCVLRSNKNVFIFSKQMNDFTNVKLYESFKIDGNIVKHRFLHVYYCSLENKNIEIKIPTEHYVCSNELLSALYVARYLKHNFPTVAFDSSYTIKIMDYNLNTIELNSSQSVVLNEVSYKIKTT